MESQISNQKEAFASVLIDIKNDFMHEQSSQSQKNEEIRKSIESFLPGATAVGLAEAYDKAKIKQEKQITAWKWTFTVTMIVMLVSVSVFYLNGAYSLSPSMSAWEVFIQFLKILPIEFPLIWLGLVANRKINQHTRLHEEYLHKWSVARTFEGLRLKAEAVDGNASSHLNSLFENFICENAANPSGTLESAKSDDSPIQKIKECFSRKGKADNTQDHKKIESLPKVVSQEEPEEE